MTVWRLFCKVTINVELWRVTKWPCNYAGYSQVTDIWRRYCEITMRVALWLDSQCYIFVTSNDDVSKSNRHLVTSVNDCHLRVIMRQIKDIPYFVSPCDCEACNHAWHEADVTSVSGVVDGTYITTRDVYIIFFWILTCSKFSILCVLLKFSTPAYFCMIFCVLVYLRTICVVVCLYFFLNKSFLIWRSFHLQKLF